MEGYRISFLGGFGHSKVECFRIPLVGSVENLLLGSFGNSFLGGFRNSLLGSFGKSLLGVSETRYWGGGLDMRMCKVSDSRSGGFRKFVTGGFGHSKVEVCHSPNIREDSARCEEEPNQTKVDIKE